MLVMRMVVVPEGGGPEKVVATMRLVAQPKPPGEEDDDLQDFAVEASRDGRNWKRSKVESFPHKEQGMFELAYRALESLLLERTARRRAGT